MYNFVSKIFIKTYKDSSKDSIAQNYWLLLAVYIFIGLCSAFFANLFPSLVSDIDIFNKIVDYSKNMERFNSNKIPFSLEVKFSWFVNLIFVPLFSYLIYKNGLPKASRKGMIDGIKQSSKAYRYLMIIVFLIMPVALFSAVWVSDGLIFLVTTNMILSVVTYSVFWFTCCNIPLVVKELLTVKVVID